jgi:hypothetical protein
MFKVELARSGAGRGSSRAGIAVAALFAARLALAGLPFGITPGSAEPKSLATDSWLPGPLAQRAEARISMASPIVAEPASQISFTIDVGPREAVPITGFIRVRGLPELVSISDGHATGPGSWAIPLYALPVLKMNIPASIAARSEFEIALLSIDGQVLAESRALLVVSPPPGLDAARQAEPVTLPATLPAPAPSKMNPAVAPAQPSPENKGTAELVAQGERYLAQGKVAGARLFFRQAADAGFARGAMRLAATYDPVELSILKVQGITPDPIEARKWYERARELGAADAEERLARLGN